MQRGEVRLSGGSVSLPDTPGLRVVGWLDTVSLDEWRAFLPSDTAPPASKRNSTPPFLNSADVAMRRLEAYGQQLQDVQLKLAYHQDRWQREVQSQEM